jgi:Ca2+-binding EF-hand superfamily protein
MSYVEKYLKYKAKYLALQQSLAGGYLNDNEIELVFEIIDSDNSGSIDENEFLNFFMGADESKDGSVSRKELRNYMVKLFGDLFTLVDADINGKIDGQIKLNEVDKIFDAIDNNKDGHFTIEELKAYMTKINSNLPGPKKFKSIEASSKRIFHLMDAGEKPDHKITKDEFTKVINTVIGAADEDKNGTVTECEFREQIISISTDVFTALDVDHDEKLTRPELKALFEKYSGTDKKLSKAEFSDLLKKKPVGSTPAAPAAPSSPGRASSAPAAPGKAAVSPSGRTFTIGKPERK